MPADSQNPEMSVSDLLLYTGCPRQVYFVSRGFELIPEMSTSRIERMLLKELALTYSEILNKCSLNADSLHCELEAALTQAQRDLPLLFPGEFASSGKDILVEGAARARAQIPEITANLLKAAEEYGKDALLAALTPVKTEPLLSSGKLNLKGVPSKLVRFEGALVPSVIRPGSCPIQGVWASDRLHAAAFVLLLEAESGEEVPFAFVEYAAFGLVRKVIIRSTDRREVLKICRRVEKIKAGFMPERKEGKLCKQCNFLEPCGSGSSLMSKFF
ncbi:Dna2/Cas4 domain-containing protein [Methanosarcina sp. KYL-1]|uniref:Dna2/Cas4 domain-containing protein n=1 Tax=Methanosarcina sp. KYL-1 TaxID=2602068 RepID=UPI002100EEBF|nr:Dna2/Cas4 domain-containing protein [Methanosarcina sp. KYL-1]MCQ1534266.1 Dna2/Cas4 domain-containing protein [Methanosarcina sp. KYL-1]